MQLEALLRTAIGERRLVPCDRAEGGSGGGWGSREGKELWPAVGRPRSFGARESLGREGTEMMLLSPISVSIRIWDLSYDLGLGLGFSLQFGLDLALGSANCGTYHRSLSSWLPSPSSWILYAAMNSESTGTHSAPEYHRGFKKQRDSIMILQQSIQSTRFTVHLNQTSEYSFLPHFKIQRNEHSLTLWRLLTEYSRSMFSLIRPKRTLAITKQKLFLHTGILLN